MPDRLRIGFIVGKDNDLVEDLSFVGDRSFLVDLPSQFRVDPSTNTYLRKDAAADSGRVHVDVAIAWHVHKHNPDLEVDIICPGDISMERFKSNQFNYVLGYDAINAAFESPGRLRAVCDIFRGCGNMVPGWEFQEFVYFKSRYMNACIDAGIPMAPTVFARIEDRSPSDLLEKVIARGWKRFVLKQSFSAFSIGFCRLSVEECQKDPSILEGYFKEHVNCPEYLAQERIDGFKNNWETRIFWFDGEFAYAIANKAAVSTEDGQEVIVTGDDIPAEFLENAKRIGREALKVLPRLVGADGQRKGLPVVRTDIGCSEGVLFDNQTNWDPQRRTFFLNEIEYGGTNYFARHLKFDCVPLWSKLYAEKSRELCCQGSSEPCAKRQRVAGEEARVQPTPARSSRGCHPDATVSSS
eukprot:CAMPEP_0115106300 /NCGR_PEP_ID=MMETSP0227-20121206/36575_1 /TAXON_ID=89957 /ORGANISM="Polarella glacialis, Strain CCMP 1383" /LENGTH=410 /DNA_ID=CAMNT_0002503875 /DNA_START=76 /DNA_END=1308 /DNA_ORIENTATION=+